MYSIQVTRNDKEIRKIEKATPREIRQVLRQLWREYEIKNHNGYYVNFKTGIELHTNW